MLNSYIQNFNTYVNIKPACTGILQKSHPNSFFKRFNKSSEMASWVFSENPCLKKRDNDCRVYQKYMDIIVLQVMCFGEEEFLCELLDKKLLDNE